MVQFDEGKMLLARAVGDRQVLSEGQYEFQTKGKVEVSNVWHQTWTCWCLREDVGDGM